MPTPDWNAFVRHTPQVAAGCCVWTRMRSWEGLVVAARVPARNRFTRHISLRMAEGLGVRVWSFVASYLSVVAAKIFLAHIPNSSLLASCGLFGQYLM